MVSPGSAAPMAAWMLVYSQPLGHTVIVAACATPVNAHPTVMNARSITVEINAFPKFLLSIFIFFLFPLLNFLFELQNINPFRFFLCRLIP